MFQTVSSAVLSSLHCAQYCNQRNSSDCNMYVYLPSAPTCHLGNILQTHTHLATQTNEPGTTIGIDVGKIFFVF